MITFRVFEIVMLVLLALTGTAVVLMRNPKRQVFMAGIYGVLQAIVFYMLHSPDVALSELAVSTVALPALVLATLAKLEREK